MINLELYRIFYVVAKEKNITKASEVLNISQPAVTKHIKNLESAIGEVLFIRTKKGVVLNEYGKKIFLNIKNALSLIEDAECDLLELKELHNSTIRIGTSTTLAKEYLIDYIEKFHDIYPNVIFDIYTDPTNELIKKIKMGDIDFIFSKFPFNLDYDLNYKKLGSMEYIFVASKKYLNLKKRNLDICDLEKYDILLQKSPSNSRCCVEEYFKENKLNIIPKMNIASSNLLTSFVKMGYGIGYVTDMYVKREIEKGEIFKIKLNVPNKKVDYGIITLKNNVMFKDCINFIKTLIEDNN